MKHYPAPRGPARIEGLEHTRSPFLCPRPTALLAAAVIFATGFFAGAILFGAALTASLP